MKTLLPDTFDPRRWINRSVENGLLVTGSRVVAGDGRSSGGVALASVPCFSASAAATDVRIHDSKILSQHNDGVR